MKVGIALGCTQSSAGPSAFVIRPREGGRDNSRGTSAQDQSLRGCGSSDGGAKISTRKRERRRVHVLDLDLR